MKRTYVDEKENLPRPNKSSKSSRLTKDTSKSSDADGLASMLECPICYFCFTEKVFVCSNGHSICSSCYSKLKTKKCPSCRFNLNGARNQALEAVLAHTSLPCRYAEYGCNFKANGRLQEAHHDHCVYRPVRCLFHRCYPNCKWHGTPTKLHKHLKSHCIVRTVTVGVRCDVYWSYETKERCWQRGKDATFFVPTLNRFYYMSISRKDEFYHLAVVWLPVTNEAAKDHGLSMKVTFPLENNQSISITIKPPRLDSGLKMDDNVKQLIEKQESFIIPIQRWRSQWLEDRKKFYFCVSATWDYK